MRDLRLFKLPVASSFLLFVPALTEGWVSSVVAILKRLQQEGVPEAQTINLKIMMANVTVFQDTLSAVLSSTS